MAKKKAKKQEETTQEPAGETLLGNRPKITAASNIMKKSGFMPASKRESNRYILTGMPQFDNARKLDYAVGMKCSGVTVVYGEPSAGKSTSVYSWIANWQKQGLVGALMDLEDSWDPVWAAKLGVDVDSLFLTQVPEFMDSALQSALDALEGKYFDFVVMDSLHAVGTKREINRDKTLEEEKPVAALAGKVTQFLRVAKPFLEKSQSAMVIIGHARMDIGSMSKNPIMLTGGEHLIHECDNIFQVTKSTSKTRAPWVNDQLTGHAMGVWVEKCRGPGIYSRFDEIFITNHGFSQAWVYVPKVLSDTKAALDLFKQAGHFYTWTDAQGSDQKLQGRQNLINYFQENPMEIDRLIQAYKDYTSGSNTEQREEPAESLPA